MSDIESPSKEYDTLVSLAVKKDPLSFVDILRKEAELAEQGELKELSPISSSNYTKKNIWTVMTQLSTIGHMKPYPML